MTTDLHDALHARADRAPQDPDLDEVLTDIRARADRAGRRHRNLLAGGGGSLAVVALVAGVIAVAPGDRSDSSAPGDPAGRASAPVASGTDHDVTRAAERRRIAEKQQALAAERQRLAAKARARNGAAARLGLVSIAPAPRSAEVSITLVPRGWVLLSHQGPNTLYGPPALRGSSPYDFEGKVLVSVHDRVGAGGSYPLTVAGRPASYQDGRNGTYQGVDVIIDDSTEVNIQLPETARLTRADAIRLANTLDVRSTVVKAHG